jgi:hypothetical protein
MSQSKKSPIPRNKVCRRIPASTSAELATRLNPLVLRRAGLADEIYYVPRCKNCGAYVLDFKAANVSTVGERTADLVPLGDFGDAKVFLIPSDGAFVFCKECDNTDHSPWVTANCIFQTDQRREFEKRGWA